jgi:hypothetical protein
LGTVLDFPGESIDCVGVWALVHSLADESECIGKFIDRPQIPFYFTNRIEDTVVQRGHRRPEVNNFCHGPPSSPIEAATYAADRLEIDSLSGALTGNVAMATSFDRLPEQLHCAFLQLKGKQ